MLALLAVSVKWGLVAVKKKAVFWLPACSQHAWGDPQASHELLLGVCRMCRLWQLPAARLHRSCMQQVLCIETSRWRTLYNCSLALT